MRMTNTIIGLALTGLFAAAPAAEERPAGQRMLERLDADGDGAVSFAEFQEGADEGMDQLDADGDGLLSLEEFMAAEPRGRRGRGDGGSPEERSARMEQMRGRMAARVTERFQEQDTDGDGLLSVAELTEARFLALDENGDGLLDGSELRRPERGRFGRRGGPRGRGRPR